jgi:thiol-disulfide isomerase/thioredoxin
MRPCSLFNEVPGKRFRFLRTLVLLLSLVFLSGVPARSATLTDRLGLSVFDAREMAPEISAPDLSGHELRLSDFRGKVVLLNFWATWCDPCRKEIPSLISLQAKLKGSPFEVVSVAMDRRIEHIPPFVRHFKIRYPVMEGRKGSVDSRYYGLGLPQTYIIDRKGMLVGRVVGGRDWSQPAFVSYFKSLASKDNPSAVGSEKGTR